MKISKGELIAKIEEARAALNESIDSGEDYAKVYEKSVALDGLLERFIGIPACIAECFRGHQKKSK